MSKIILKIDTSDDVSSKIELTRNYQEMIIGNLESKSFIETSSSFMYSLAMSHLATTFKKLSLHNIEIQRDSFMVCLLGLRSLEELTLVSVKCRDDETFYANGIVYDVPMTHTPELKSLVLDFENCESTAVMNALLIMKVQSRHIEFSYGFDMNQLSLLISHQKCLESLVITRLWPMILEHLMEKLVDCRTDHKHLKKIVILDKIADPYYAGSNKLNVYFSFFLSTYALNLRELHLEACIDFAVLRAIANNMKLMKLSFKKLKQIAENEISVIRPNMHLKTLFNQSAEGMNVLTMIFPAVETLKTSFCHGQSMDILSNFNCLKNLCLIKASNFSVPTFQMPSLRIVSFNFERHFYKLNNFLISNSHSIETLMIKHFIFPFPYGHPSRLQITADGILKFFSKFKRIVLTDDSNDLSLLQGYDPRRLNNYGFFIDVKIATYKKAKNYFGENSDLLNLLRCVKSSKIIEELNKKFKFDF